MRITVHLDTFDHPSPAAYAILWLDNLSLKWSREAHVGLPLPEWGQLRVDGNNTLICGPDIEAAPLCTLDGLMLDQQEGPYEGETGTAHWRALDATPNVLGHWHVQCLDENRTLPESSYFPSESA